MKGLRRGLKTGGAFLALGLLLGACSAPKPKAPVGGSAQAKPTPMATPTPSGPRVQLPFPRPLRTPSLRWPLDLSHKSPPKHALTFYPEGLKFRARRKVDAATLMRLQDIYGYIAERRVLAPADPVAIALGDQQRLFLLCEDRGTLWIDGIYMMSSGRKGFADAPIPLYYSPHGLHVIYDKHGTGLPEGTLLESRVSTGRLAEVSDDYAKPVGASVTTRVLWLSGREPHNHDSYENNIYLHGTTREYSLGGADSTGCFRLRNSSVVELYDKMLLSAPIYVDPGSKGWVSPKTHPKAYYTPTPTLSPTPLPAGAQGLSPAAKALSPGAKALSRAAQPQWAPSPTPSPSRTPQP